MLTVDFKPINVKNYEMKNGSVYNAIGYNTHYSFEFLKVATGCDDDVQIQELFLHLKEEKGGIVGLVDYLIDECDAGGFFPNLTGAEVKKIAKAQLERQKKMSLLSEEEKAKEAAKLVMAQISGLKNGKK